ncbi:polysaccharide pyruvyl transferase family protein [Streptomyces sp. NPDC052107]|uniref:polysaccharide pyruvyl transferase family protein n=1 Tax=Streptomyces sp. NPDC052107 TaxID=3155632 RepID=UPI0034372AE7
MVLSHGQGEYGARRRHEEIDARLTGWVAGKDCARLPADTRLATDDWRLCATAERFLALVSRCDLVVTTRLHGLVLALRTGTPVIAVGRVAGRAKVGAQVRAVGWPALVDAGAQSEELLDHWWRWARAGWPRPGTRCADPARMRRVARRARGTRRGDGRPLMGRRDVSQEVTTWVTAETSSRN